MLWCYQASIVVGYLKSLLVVRQSRAISRWELLRRRTTRTFTHIQELTSKLQYLAIPDWILLTTSVFIPNASNEQRNTERSRLYVRVNVCYCETLFAAPVWLTLPLIPNYVSHKSLFTIWLINGLRNNGRHVQCVESIDHTDSCCVRELGENSSLAVCLCNNTCF